MTAALPNPHGAASVAAPEAAPSQAAEESTAPGATTWRQSITCVGLHVALITILVMLILGGSFLLRQTAQGYAEQWRTYLIPQTFTTLKFPPETAITAAEQVRLTQLHTAIQHRERLHASIMEVYYTRFYMGVITLSVTTAVAAIMLVLISRRGWENVNQYLVTTFFVASAASVFFGSLPGVFRQDQNITENKVLLLKFLALENEVQSYVITGEALNYTVKPEDLLRSATTLAAQEAPARNPDNAEANPSNTEAPQAPSIGIPLSVPEFIHYVDLQLAQDNIAIGFDYEQVPNYQGVFDLE